MSQRKRAPRSNGVRSTVEYDSNTESLPFASWSLYSTSEGLDRRITVVSGESKADSAFRLEAFGTEKVGVNKSFRAIRGRITFRYTTGASNSDGLNLFFYAIPMQETGVGRFGLIEVGTNVEDHPKNAFSPYRARLVVPRRYYGDGRWHDGVLAFDFREISEAFYTIFGPRINEGAVSPTAGVLLISRVRLFVR